MSNAIGSHWERDLVNLLYGAGHGVMRIPASGGATEHELPDVFAGIGGESYAIEAKYSSSDVIYLTGKEVEALEEFAARFGAIALVGARFSANHGDPHYGNDDCEGWFFFDPGALYVTDGGNYRVKREFAFEHGTPLEELYT